MMIMSVAEQLNTYKSLESKSEKETQIVIKPYNYTSNALFDCFHFGDKSVFTPQIVSHSGAYLRKTVGTQPNTYVYQSMGMGCSMYSKSNADCSLIEYLFLYDTDNEDIQTNIKVQNFLSNCEKYKE
jgi:hypothetical protein